MSITFLIFFFYHKNMFFIFSHTFDHFFRLRKDISLFANDGFVFAIKSQFEQPSRLPKNDLSFHCSPSAIVGLKDERPTRPVPDFTLCKKVSASAHVWCLTSCRASSCREITDHGRGVKSRLSAPVCSRFTISVGSSIYSYTFPRFLTRAHIWTHRLLWRANILFWWDRKRTLWKIKRNQAEK